MITNLFQNRISIPILFLALGIFGAVITPHFGESWDELKFFKYADLELEAYRTWPVQGSIETFGNTYDDYGPAYVMVVTLAAKPLQVLFSESDARHFLYFLTYLAGVWAFYKLASRWLSQRAAVFSTLLFSTQPLFIGHAFISPKDMPFLAFFMLSLHFGLRLFDSPLTSRATQVGAAAWSKSLRFTLLWLALVFVCFLFTDTIHSLIADLILAARAGQANIFSVLTSDILKADPQVYIQRYFVFFLRFRTILFLLSSLLLLLALRHHVPAFIQTLPAILGPAFLLGFSTSIRILGPFAAVFIIHHALRKHGRQALPYLTAYALLAIASMYWLWPYLWINPLGHFIEGMLVMSRYPWNGQVLFNGTFHLPEQLPSSYLPLLLGIQFTEPVWVLVLWGLVTAARGDPRHRELIGVAIVWFLLPLLGFVLTHAPLYDNFRQIFFILPPVFMLAGIILEKIRKPSLQIILIVLCLLPGILDAVRLHPYEYIYYNRVVGGVQGAFRKFELDYWGTSYREAAQYINGFAPQDAAVWVDGPAHIFEVYARHDVKVYSDYESERADHYDYVVSTTRYNLDRTSFPNADILHVIEREGAILTVIKQP